MTSNAEYAASRHAVWVCATALMTDPWGRVLLVRPSYRDTWLLPGGGVEAGELPSEGCRREVWEETGLTRTPGAALAVDHVSPRIEGLPEDLPCLVVCLPAPYTRAWDTGVDELAPEQIRQKILRSDLIHPQFTTSNGGLADAEYLVVVVPVVDEVQRVRTGWWVCGVWRADLVPPPGPPGLPWWPSRAPATAGPAWPG